MCFSLENDSILKQSPLSIAELAGVSGKWATCLTTRVSGRNELKPVNIINGDDFVTVHNSSGANKFNLLNLESILTRFKPDFFIGPFDEHSIPMSLKRVRRAVDRNLKYEKIYESSCAEIPFVSSISGAESLAEKERNVAGISEKSSGVAFCDIHRLESLEERVNILSEVLSNPKRENFIRIVRGSISPSEMSKFLPFVDVIDTTFVDEITEKGHALRLNFASPPTQTDHINLWDEEYFEDFGPISEGCTCHTCKNYKRSYVHHLLKSHEMLAGVLLMMHNLDQYYRWLEYLKLNLK